MVFPEAARQIQGHPGQVTNRNYIKCSQFDQKRPQQGPSWTLQPGFPSQPELTPLGAHAVSDEFLPAVPGSPRAGSGPSPWYPRYPAVRLAIAAETPQRAPASLPDGTVHPAVQPLQELLRPLGSFWPHPSPLQHPVPLPLLPAPHPGAQNLMDVCRRDSLCWKLPTPGVKN